VETDSLSPSIGYEIYGDDDMRLEKENTGKPENITRLSVYYNDAYGLDAYEYALEEENGEILFTYSCLINPELDFEIVVVFDKIPVDYKYLEELRSLAGKHEFLGMNERDWPLVPDEPIKRLELHWPNIDNGRDSLSSSYFPPGTEEVVEFFKSLAESCAN
jgi:hypothetical protein